jgi:hypothetical protein
MIFCVKLSNNIDDRVLRYQLNNNHLVVEWISLFLKTRNSPYFLFRGKFSYRMSNDFYFKTYEDLLKNSHKIKIQLPKSLDNLKQTHINRLFELSSSSLLTIDDRIFFKDSTTFLETYVRGDMRRNDYIQINMLPLIKKTFDSSLYEYFQDYVEFGGLYMKYDGATKNLYGCYKKNHMEVVRNKQVRPQTEIITDLFLNFINYKINPTISNKRFLKWCEKNKVDQYGIDYLDPKHQAKWGKLGKLIQDYDFDIYETIENYQNITDIWLEND